MIFLKGVLFLGVLFLFSLTFATKTIKATASNKKMEVNQKNQIKHW